MKTPRLLFILLGAMCIIAWMTRDYEVSLAGLLPFADEGPASLYDLVGLIMVIWAGWAARRLWLQR